MRNPIFRILMLMIMPLTILAQTKQYTFDQCVKMAVSQNLDLKIQENQAKKAAINIRESKWNIAPSISGSASSGLNFRRSTNQNNDIASGTSYNVGYHIGGSLLLFRGLTRMNTISANKFMELAYRETFQQMINKLYMNVANLFANVLYLEELITVSEEKLSVNKKEEERISTNIDLGLMEEAALLEITATISSNTLHIKRLKNQHKLALLELAQLIDFPEPDSFEIDGLQFTLLNPTESNFDVNTVYNTACANLPDVRAMEYQLRYMKKNVQIAKGNLYPSLSLNGGYSSGFYSTDTLPDGSKTPISSQFRNYLNPSLSMSLSIPLFYGFSNRFNIKRQKLNLENTVYELEKTKKILKKEIETSLSQLDAMKQEYKAALDNLSYTEKYFNSFREQYRLGLINSTDFNTAQNQLSEAKANVASARYNWIVQEKIIKVYTGEAIIPAPETSNSTY